MIRLENIQHYSIQLNEKFFAQEDKSGNLLSLEDKAQIITLDKAASAFLWNYQSVSFPVNFGLEDVFSVVQTWNRRVATTEKSRKWLYQRQIELKQEVFVPVNPDLAFIMTWNMIIKYYRSILKLNRQFVWDQSLNWCLYYYETGENVQWSFYRNRINKNNKESR